MFAAEGATPVPLLLVLEWVAAGRGEPQAGSQQDLSCVSPAPHFP